MMTVSPASIAERVSGVLSQCAALTRSARRPSAALSALLGGLVLAGPLSGVAAPGRPNVLFILTDDQRFDSVGANGNPHIHTPNLDRLAARSVRFTNANVVMSLCSPSRAAILTGRYGSSNGVTSLGAALRPGETTFAQHLKSAGYRTGMVGKWHIGGEPEAVGFDFSCFFRSNGTYFGRPVRDQGKDVRPAQHVDEYCVDRSIAFLEDAARRTGPFLLWHATQLPHMDNRNAWPSPEEFRALYDPKKLPLPSTIKGDLTGKPPYLAGVRNRTQADKYGYDDPAVVRGHVRDYYAVVTQLDGMIGRLLDALERLGLRDNTWIVFMSDNGWLLGEQRMTSKVLAYADSIRVPLMIAGPGLKPRVEPGLALNIDITPTLLELAALPASKTMHGRSLVPLLRDANSAWRDAFVYECLDSYGGTRPMLGAMNAEWSLIQTWETRADVGTAAPPFVELYHRRTDPAEQRNVAVEPANAAIREQLQREIRDHLAQILSAPAGAR
ncbi:MAG: sulfatase-like hydrolase/transferase [Opitutaceae bacterium]|nr:sulfatase-like hydrolase/transferase [Opitutaceae bacterium]